jgi:hypothetical protein
MPHASSTLRGYDRTFPAETSCEKVHKTFPRKRRGVVAGPQRLGPRSFRGLRTLGESTAEDLLPQDVCMSAVLGEFAQYVEVHPAQRARTAPVAVDPVVQAQG